MRPSTYAAPAAADPAAAIESRYDIKRIAAALGISARAAQMRADRERWAFETTTGRGGKKRLYALAGLPESTQAAVLLRYARRAPINATCARLPVWTEQRIASAWQRYEAVKQPLKDTAHRRLKALQVVETLERAGTSRMQARAIVAEQLQREGIAGTSAASIARWQDAVDGAHVSDRLALLVPHYAGRSVTAEMPAEAWELFKGDWLRLEAPTATSCYDRLRRIATTKDWPPLPSLATFTRRIERELPRQVRVLAREGEEALMRTYPAQERDRSVFGALEGVNADGHMWDVAVRMPDGERIGRPIIVAWQDLGSGKMLSWRMAESESRDLVRLAFCDLVSTYGIPGAAWLDNGRAFASKLITGGTPNRYRFKIREEDPRGIITELVGPDNVHWVTPYHGQAKPIERAWRDFCDRIAKHPAFAGAYLGNNPMSKPENYGSRAIDWNVFVAVVAEEIAAHNARQGRTGKHCNGRSFDRIFNESYAVTTIRKASADQLRTLLLATEAVTASAVDGSVKLAGNRYWTPALAKHAGRKALMRFDPMSLHTGVHCYALDGSYIGYADCVASVGFADTNAAREHAQAKKHYRKASKQMLTAERRMDAAAVAAQMPTVLPPTLPEAGVIAPVFAPHARRVAAAAEPIQRTGTDDGPDATDAFCLEAMRRRRDEHEPFQ